MNFGKQLWAAVRALAIFTVLLGVAYPLAVTGLARLMPDRADGSIITVEGREVGSSLLGQPASGPEWFQGRPSASNASGATSGGSNLGPHAAPLAQQINEREQALRRANPDAPAGPIPPDALTASASGLDPHISPEYAAWQAPRVAKARGMSLAQVRELIDASTQRPALGFVGTERVNIATLNVALASTGR